MLTVGDRFPEFKVQACVNLDDKPFAEITNETYKGKWQVYLFYPKDFTFVCPTELVEFGKKLSDFKDRDAVLIGGSTDNEYCHLAWRKSHEDLKDLPYPMIAAQKLALDLGIVHPEAHVCLRATFVVDPDGIIQFATVNSLSVGRNVDEVLRVIDAIQSDELCPCNWKKGEPTLKV